MCNHLGRIGLLLAAACISNESVDIGSASAATSIELFAKYGPYGTIIWPYARSYGTYGALRLIRMRQYGFPDNSYGGKLPSHDACAAPRMGSAYRPSSESGAEHVIQGHVRQVMWLTASYTQTGATRLHHYISSSWSMCHKVTQR